MQAILCFLVVVFGAVAAATPSLVTDARASQTQSAHPIRIVLVGDSTVAQQNGWGPGFAADLAPNAVCVNYARNGRSTKSFIDEGLWQKALDEKGAYYLIQFGHNDEKVAPKRHTDPETSYAENLRKFIRESKAINAIPVVISPLSRRTFKKGKPSNPSLQLYANAARRVATEEHVSFIDLLSLSNALLGTMTQAEADAFDATGSSDAKAENSGKPAPALDRTHLNPKGQQVFGRMVVDELVRVQPELRPDVLPTSPAAAKGNL